MALMSLRSRSHVKASMVLTRADHLFIHNYIISHVKASMVLTRADHLCIHNYIRSLLNNILRPIL